MSLHGQKRIVIGLAGIAIAIGLAAGCNGKGSRSAETKPFPAHASMKSLQALVKPAMDRPAPAKPASGRNPAAANAVPTDSIRNDYPLNLNFNANVRANLQAEVIVAAPAQPLPGSVRITQASFNWSLDPSVI